MTDGIFLLRATAVTRSTVDGRPAWTVRVASRIGRGAIVMIEDGPSLLRWRRTIGTAMRVADVRPVSDRNGRTGLALLPASVWPLARRFALGEALGPGASAYDTRDCPLRRLSPLHEHLVRTHRWLGADVGPVDRPELDVPVREVFHALWSLATDSPRYDKRKWGELRAFLQQRGIEV